MNEKGGDEAKERLEEAGVRPLREVTGAGLTRRFVVFGIKDALLLSEENAVLEIGVMKKSGPPIPLQALFRDRVIGGTTSERSPAA
ncbi:TPA: hypothetical protein MI346_14885 [Klebsiella pneumoniae]|uniref:hypothetical protein n=1 Tax=Klebsiella pneumoniae TaxID=573 RepID=UPI000F66996D|nr:hypothetical protein [Klebsiella pneumoniae]RRZ57353.1 hypothetical protein EGK29_12450 [Klebsiella pneumoniae]HBY6028438.1 hypothetical protein [Klebsiella pneumoniae]